MVFLRPSSPRTFINNFLSASLIIYFLEMLGVESLSLTILVSLVSLVYLFV
jgi:hypothetical protein